MPAERLEVAACVVEEADLVLAAEVGVVLPEEPRTLRQLVGAALAVDQLPEDLVGGVVDLVDPPGVTEREQDVAVGESARGSDVDGISVVGIPHAVGRGLDVGGLDPDELVNIPAPDELAVGHIDLLDLLVLEPAWRPAGLPLGRQE